MRVSTASWQPIVYQEMNYMLECCEKLKNSCLQVKVRKYLSNKPFVSGMYTALLVKFQTTGIYLHEVLQVSTLKL